MPLHHRKTIEEHLEATIHVGQNVEKSLPRYKFPDDTFDPTDALKVIEDELLLDGNARQNLATFCQTWEEPNVTTLMIDGQNKNLIDKDEYPHPAELEKRCVNMLADLWNAPKGTNPVGTSAIGSSEACMLAGMAAKWRWREARSKAGKPTDKPNMVCGPVQVVWHKFARYWDIEIREVGMAPGRFGMEPEQMLEQVDENTILVVPTLGVTYTGGYEDVAALAAALDDLEARTGLDVPIHIDAASGGFVAPFCAPELVWDFRIERVHSISTSGHKFGLAPLGVGWVVWRDAAFLSDDLIFHVSYLGGDMPVFQINFSRPAGQIIAQYYNFIRLGRGGYREVHSDAYDIARYLTDELKALHRIEMIYEPDPMKGIPALTWRIPEGADYGFTLYDLADRLRTHGWLVPAYPLTGELSETTVQRILVRRDLSRDLAENLLTDMAAAIEHLIKHPMTTHMTKEESGNFSHL